MFETRYFLKISFDGTDFHGWQTQHNAHTLQAEISAALSRLLRHPSMSIMGCGRTDAGVHAAEYYLHFQHTDENLESSDLLFKLNRFLPRSIAAHSIKKMEPRAHARYDAVSRTYHYHITSVKNPFKFNRAWHVWTPLDVDKMNQCARYLLQVNDFASFCKSGAGSTTTLCDVTEAHWLKTGNDMVFVITANRFLRNMVRAVVGTLMEAGKGNLSEKEFIEIVDSKDRRRAGESVPAHGLYLQRVIYPYPVE